MNAERATTEHGLKANRRQLLALERGGEAGDGYWRFRIGTANNSARDELTSRSG
jgi:hypothetical protein